MTLIERYAELTALEKSIEVEKKEISEKLLAEMKEQQIGSLSTDFGTFSKAQKLVYEYSEEFKEEEAKVKQSLKESRELEESKLTPTVKEYLIFRSK